MFFFALEDQFKYDWEIFFQKFRKQFESSRSEHYYRAQCNKLERKKDENIRMFALRVKQTVDKGWLYATKEQKNNYYTDYFTQGIRSNY